MTKVNMPAMAKALIEEANLFEKTGRSEFHSLISNFARRVALNLTKRHNERIAQLEADESYLDALAEISDPNS